MKPVLVLLALAGFSLAHHRVSAESYGYIRVRVLEQNLDHNFMVNLRTNGVILGQPFSHASTGFTWTSVSAQNINADGASTPIAATYGFAREQCSFRYQVYFSFSPSGDGISLGVYDAPASTSAGALPLGLDCGGRRKGEICSQNSAIQNEIHRSLTQKRVSDYRAYKAEYDRRMARERQALRARQTAIEARLEQKAKSAAAPANDTNPVLKELVDRVQADLKQMRSEERRAAATESAASQADAVTPLEQSAIDADVRRQVSAAIEAQRGPLIASGLGAYAVALNDLNQATEQTLSDLNRLHNDIVRSGSNDPEEIIQIKRQMANVDWTRRQVLNPEVFIATAKEGLRFTPASDAIDLCEAVTGRAFCSGEALPWGDRFMAAAGVIIGSRLMWKAIKTRLTPEILTAGEEFVRTVDRLQLEPKYARRLASLAGDGVVDPSGRFTSEIKAQIRNSQFSGKLLDIVLPNGNKIQISRDIGRNAHKIRSLRGDEIVDHWNVRAKKPDIRPGRFKTSFNLHILVDDDLKILQVVETRDFRRGKK